MLEIKASLEFFFSHTAEGQHEQIVFLFVLLVRFCCCFFVANKNRPFHGEM